MSGAKRQKTIYSHFTCFALMIDRQSDNKWSRVVEQEDSGTFASEGASQLGIEFIHCMRSSLLHSTNYSTDGGQLNENHPNAFSGRPFGCTSTWSIFPLISNNVHICNVAAIHCQRRSHYRSRLKKSVHRRQYAVRVFQQQQEAHFACPAYEVNIYTENRYSSIRYQT